jgi:hypothetical protein
MLADFENPSAALECSRLRLRLRLRREACSSLDVYGSADRPHLYPCHGGAMAAIRGEPPT